MHKCAAVGSALIVGEITLHLDGLARKEHVHCAATRADILAVAAPTMTCEQWLGSYAVTHRSAAASTCDGHRLSPLFARCASDQERTLCGDCQALNFRAFRRPGEIAIMIGRFEGEQLTEDWVEYDRHNLFGSSVRFSSLRRVMSADIRFAPYPTSAGKLVAALPQGAKPKSSRKTRG